MKRNPSRVKLGVYTFMPSATVITSIGFHKCSAFFIIIVFLLPPNGVTLYQVVDALLTCNDPSKGTSNHLIWSKTNTGGALAWD